MITPSLETRQATIKKMEMLSAKTTWVKEILNSTQQNINDPKIANILLGVEFILDSLLADA